ncbi:hypothetical protein [Bdellovibrio sp.]|uniref:hypothetical protein n=1 Tax=Bdellovibrio sp. TaxID=28201 RepID=UPI0039E253A2
MKCTIMPAIFLSTTTSLLIGCGDLTAGMKFSEKALNAAYPECIDDELNSVECRTQLDRYVTAKSGNNVVVSAGTTIPIPTGYYDGSKNIVVSDIHLDPSNIKAGTTILGVTGVMTTTAYDSCADNGLNTSPCSTGVNRYVTSTLGADLTISGSLSANIPQGYYDGTKKATVVDGNLIASNIRSGISVLGISGTLVSSAPACSDNAFNSSACTTSASRYVASVLGSNVTVSGGLNATIPAGYQDGTKSCTVTDGQLIAGNIRSGTTILGVTGTLPTAAYAACSDNSLNASQCSTAANRYVTATLGSNVTLSGSTSATIPAGYQNGVRTCSVSDGNLSSSNIKSGVSILGVSGSLTPAYSWCSNYQYNSSNCTAPAGSYVAPVDPTPANCTSYGQRGCVVTGSFYAGSAPPAANYITIGNTINGVAGTFGRLHMAEDLQPNNVCTGSDHNSLYPTIIFPAGLPNDYSQVYCASLCIGRGGGVNCAHFNLSTRACNCKTGSRTTTGATANDTAANLEYVGY